MSAASHRGMFNVIDAGSGWKADLILRKNRPSSATEFAQRVQARMVNRPLSVVAPEDAILSKLEWSKETESSRQ